MPIAAWDAHDPDELDADALTRAYIATLREAAEAGDRSDTDTIDTFSHNDGGSVTLEAAAAILATQTERLDADAIHAELLDRLLIGMSNAVVDVETLSGELALSLSPKELQQRVEGRAPMTIAEYAHIQRALSDRLP